MAILTRLPAGKYLKVREIADICGIPLQYLSKVVQKLRQACLITSNRGPAGGIRLAHRPEKIPLKEIMDAVRDEPVHRKRCILGFGVCGESVPCPMHAAWEDILVMIDNEIEGRMLSEVQELCTIRQTARNRPTRKDNQSIRAAPQKILS